jgi:hypothetical protein
MKTASIVKQSINICFVWLAVWLSTTAYSETLSSQVAIAHYDIYIDGIKAGEAQQSRAIGLPPDPSALRIDEMSQVQVKGNWGNWNLSTASALEFTPGNIKSFDHKFSENDSRFHIRGEIQGVELWAGAHQVMTHQEKKSQEENAFLMQTAAEFVPYLGLGAQALGILGDDEETDGELLIPLKDFDATLRELPLYLKRSGYDVHDRKLRLLDTENLEVQRYSLELMGEKELNLAGKTFQCRIVRIKAPRRDIRYWITEDEISPFLVKEQGKDDGVDYEIILRNYNPDTGE